MPGSGSADDARTGLTPPNPTRTEHDSMGSIQVSTSALWGAQTQRSLENFSIGGTRYVWGRPVIRAIGLVKRAAAAANAELAMLEPALADLIIEAADEVIAGDLDKHFPLVVFQTGSGTQTNMNANEVIANRSNMLAGGELGANRPVHPNDHVNRSQSSNDVFPSVMHVATVCELHRCLYPALERLDATLAGLVAANRDLVKVGRTHLQDATPITLGQEIGGWRAQLAQASAALRTIEPQLRELAIGGTATGTGLNAPSGFGPLVAQNLSELTGMEFRVTENHFAATSAHDAMAQISAGLRTLAGGLIKMANDIRWLSSGPRNGIAELTIPANEPGSSIMPGKVNPTQAEALIMAATRVHGNDAMIAMANADGNFQLNVQKPLILDATLDSIGLLSDSVNSFRERCLVGLAPNRERIAANLETNLMLVTALAPHIGYERAARIAHVANRDGSSLRQAAEQVEGMSSAQFDEWVNPRAMVGRAEVPDPENPVGAEVDPDG